MGLAQVNHSTSQVDVQVLNLKLDELEQSSLRGNVGECSLHVNFESRTGRAKVNVDGPRFSGLQVRACDGRAGIELVGCRFGQDSHLPDLCRERACRDLCVGTETSFEWSELCWCSATVDTNCKVWVAAREALNPLLSSQAACPSILGSGAFANLGVLGMSSE